MARDFKHSFKVVAHAELPLVVYNSGFQKCPPGHGWGPGVRDHYLLHYVVSGRGTYETEGRTFVLSAGDAFLARPETPILYQADREDPWEYYWVGFAGPSAALLLAQTPFTRTHPVLHPAAGERLRQSLLDIYKARGADYPSAVRMAFRLFPGRICLISDALRCCGMPDGQYTLGGQDVFLKGGVAKLADGTIAGSAANLYECMQRAVSFGIPAEQAILSATIIPAREIGQDAEIGSIAVGKLADFVVCDAALNRSAVYLGGQAL